MPSKRELARQMTVLGKYAQAHIMADESIPDDEKEKAQKAHDDMMEAFRNLPRPKFQGVRKLAVFAMEPYIIMGFSELRNGEWEEAEDYYADPQTAAKTIINIYAHDEEKLEQLDALVSDLGPLARSIT